MRDHIKILGILNIVIGCLGALAGVIVLLVFGGLAGMAGISAGPWARDTDAAAAVPILAVIGVGIAILLFVLALPSIIGGWGLMHFRPWARVLMIVVSVFHLFHIPIGTALGVYGLWVLLNEEARRLLETGGQPFVGPGAHAAQANYPQPRSYSPPPSPGV